MFNSENSFDLLSGSPDQDGGTDNESDDEIVYSGDKSDKSGWSDSQNRKRTRKNTGGASGQSYQHDSTISKSEYEKLSIDGKLSVLFMNMNSRMNTLEQKVSDCLHIHKQVSQVENTLSDHEQRLKLLEYKSIDLESRSRRNNLIFGGITEERNEDCFNKIGQFLREHMHIDPCPPIPRSHRLGRFTPGKTRPIIVYFLDTRDTEFVLSRANKLKNTTFSVNRDFPKEIVSARKALWPEYKQLRSENPTSKVSIVYPAKIVKDGRVWKDMFPLWSLVMQGNRVTSHKQVFVNKPVLHSDNTLHESRTHSPASHVQKSPTRNVNITNNNVSHVMKEVSHARGNSTHSANGTRGRPQRRVQSSSPGATRQIRSRAPERSNNDATDVRRTGASASQPILISHRPWVPNSRQQSPANSDHGPHSTNL